MSLRGATRRNQRATYGRCHAAYLRRCCRGKRAARRKMSRGADVALGPVRVAIHVMAPSDDELRGFDGHDRFVAALADELTRARTFQRSLALLMVRGAKDAHVSRWATRVRALLR